MSKQDNLTDFLTDVANAIREKKGTTKKINPQNFSEEIRGIESGAGNHWNADVEYADETIFGQFGWKKISIYDGVKAISNHCFQNNKVIEEVIMPDTLENTGEYSFQSSNIYRLDLPDGTKTIGRYSFGSCINLHAINIPAKIESIGYGAFNGDYNIRNAFVFKSNSLTIDRQAFKGCSRIPYFDFRECTSIPTLLHSDIFTITANLKIVVPDNLYDEWIAATNWSSLASIIVKASEFVEPTTE